MQALLPIRRTGDRELVSPFNDLPSSKEKLLMAMPALLLVLQRPSVLCFVTEIATSPGNSLRFHFWKEGTVCQSCHVGGKTQRVEKLLAICLGLLRKEGRVERGFI